MKISWTRFGGYSGPRIRGSSKFEPSGLSDDHWARVLWLTSQVESGGFFGNITMYDGTAVTAGLHQAIAVFPRELAAEDFVSKDDQGSLFKLLRAVEMVPDFPEREALWDALKDKNWFVGRDGFLRYWSSAEVRVAHRKLSVSAGDMVYGWEIREEFTPGQGHTPKIGPLWKKSAKWVSLFGSVFNNPKSFQPQVQFGMGHFEEAANMECGILGGSSISDMFYDGSTSRYTPFSPEIDLALCVFWSHSVNAPAIAYRIARNSVGAPESELPRELLRRMAQSTFGRWHQSITNGRWSRTRNAAMSSGLWPDELFSASGIMPEKM